jgi:hypothetical protein
LSRNPYCVNNKNNFGKKSHCAKGTAQEGEGVEKAQKELPAKSLKYPQKQKGLSIMNGLYETT